MSPFQRSTALKTFTDTGVRPVLTYVGPTGLNSRPTNFCGEDKVSNVVMINIRQPLKPNFWQAYILSINLLTQ